MRRGRTKEETKAETLTEQAYTRLEEMIVTLKLAPGAILSEQALSSELSIGRTPIREALQRLAREGLVLVLPRKAILVTDTDPRKQLLVLEVRRELERLLARASAERASVAQRARFQAIADGTRLLDDDIRARSEKAEWKAQDQHHCVVDRKHHVDEHGQYRADGEQNEVSAAADPVGKIGAAKIAGERTEDDDREISAGSENGEVALGLQISRQPSRDGVIAALHASRKYRGQHRGLQD